MGVGGRSSIDPYDGFHPYLSSLVSGSPLGAVLHVHTVRRSYLGTNKGPQVPPISQCWSIVVTTASTPVSFAMWCPVSSGIVAMIAFGPVIFTVQ
jgi:hypothetical protein